MTKSNNNSSIEERKHKATSIKSVKLTGIQKKSSSASAAKKNSSKHAHKMSDEIPPSDDDNDSEEAEQPPKKKAKKTHATEEAATQDSDADSSTSDSEENPEQGEGKEKKKKSVIRKAPKIDVETLKQDPLMRPILLDHKERVPGLESVPSHIKGYFEHTSKVWGNPDNEEGRDEKSTAAKRKRFQNLVDLRNDVLSKNKPIAIAGPIGRIVAATINEVAETRFSGLKYETKDKDGNMVSRKPMKVSRKYLEALSKYSSDFVLESLHSGKTNTATARRLTVTEEDIKSMYVSNSFLDHLSSFGHSHGGKKGRGTESLIQLIASRRKENSKARADASAANKAKKAEREAEKERQQTPAAEESSSAEKKKSASSKKPTSASKGQAVVPATSEVDASAQ